MAETETEIEREFALLETAAVKAVDLGLGVNAGHDLNLDNLPLMQKLPGLLESLYRAPPHGRRALYWDGSCR